MGLRDSRPACASPAPIPLRLLLTAFAPVLLPGRLAAPFPDRSLHVPCGTCAEVGASSRVIIQSFNQKNIPGYSLALAGASLRNPISLKIFRILRSFPFSTFCYNMDKNTQHFLGCPDNIGLLRVLLNSDPFTMQTLRSVRFGLQIN